MAKAEFGIKECVKCEYNVRCQECIYNKKYISRLIAETKADTVKKMQERILQLFPCDKKFTTISRFTIDQIAKEMLEGKDGI